MVTPSGFALSGSRKYKMGLQLFTIRDAMEKDSLGSLKQVRSLGYEDLEIFGYDGDTGAPGYDGQKGQKGEPGVTEFVYRPAPPSPG